MKTTIAIMVPLKLGGIRYLFLKAWNFHLFTRLSTVYVASRAGPDGTVRASSVRISEIGYPCNHGYPCHIIHSLTDIRDHSWISVAHCPWDNVYSCRIFRADRDRYPYRYPCKITYNHVDIHATLEYALVEQSVARIIRHGHPHGYSNGYPRKMVRGCGHQYGYPRPVTIYLDIHTDIRADVHVKLSVLRTLRPGRTVRVIQVLKFWISITSLINVNLLF